jgi:hypothetical protein
MALLCAPLSLFGAGDAVSELIRQARVRNEAAHEDARTLRRHYQLRVATVVRAGEMEVPDVSFWTRRPGGGCPIIDPEDVGYAPMEFLRHPTCHALPEPRFEDGYRARVEVAPITHELFMPGEPFPCGDLAGARIGRLVLDDHNYTALYWSDHAMHTYATVFDDFEPHGDDVSCPARRLLQRMVRYTVDELRARRGMPAQYVSMVEALGRIHRACGPAVVTGEAFTRCHEEHQAHEEEHHQLDWNEPMKLLRSLLGRRSALGAFETQAVIGALLLTTNVAVTVACLVTLLREVRDKAHSEAPKDRWVGGHAAPQVLMSALLRIAAFGEFSMTTTATEGAVIAAAGGSARCERMMHGTWALLDGADTESGEDEDEEEEEEEEEDEDEEGGSVGDEAVVVSVRAPKRARHY